MNPLKCDYCDKPAVVHEVTVKNGQKNEVHLCEEHAQEAGVALPLLVWEMRNCDSIWLIGWWLGKTTPASRACSSHRWTSFFCPFLTVTSCTTAGLSQ